MKQALGGDLAGSRAFARDKSPRAQIAKLAGVWTIGCFNTLLRILKAHFGSFTLACLCNAEKLLFGKSESFCDKIPRKAFNFCV